MMEFNLSKLLVVIALGGICIADTSAAINQSVYLSAAGSNANDGLSPATAWKTVTALNKKEFGAGAQILFNRGDSFRGGCRLLGSGSAAQPILIGAYGTGDKPLLTGAWGRQEVIELNENEYIEFHDLQLSNYNITNTRFKQRYGITVNPSAGAGELNHLYFQDIDFLNIQGSNGEASHEDDHRSMGINMLTVDDDVNPTRFSDVLIERCTFTDIDGLGTQLLDFSQDITDVRINGTDYFPTVGFVFQDNNGYNCYRNMLMIRGTKDAVMQYNTMDTTVEGSAFWPFGTEGTLVQYNVFKHLRAADADAYVCHFDYNCIGTVMQYNFGYDVEGGLIEYIVNSQWTNAFQENGIARYNIGIDVGYRNQVNGAGILLTGRVTGGQFYNNTIIQLNQPMTNGISFSNWGGEYPDNNEIYNNIFYAAGTNEVKHKHPKKMLINGNVVSHNLYSGNIAPPTAWDGTVGDVNPLTGNLMFVNPEGITAQDFKVLAGSEAIGNGTFITNNGGLDYFGNEISSATYPTLGFYEHSTDPANNSAPVWNKDPYRLVGAVEDSSYVAYNLWRVTNAEKDSLVFDVLEAPAWITVDPASCKITGTPTQSDVGIHTIRVSVSDGVNPPVENRMRLKVVNVNDAPVFEELTVPYIANKKSAYTGGVVCATDEDGDNLTYSITGPSWLSVASDGTLSGTPDTRDIGLNVFTVQVSDGNGGSDTAVLNIMVIAPAQASRVSRAWNENSFHPSTTRKNTANSSWISEAISSGVNAPAKTNQNKVK